MRDLLACAALAAWTAFGYTVLRWAEARITRHRKHKQRAAQTAAFRARVAALDEHAVRVACLPFEADYAGHHESDQT